MTTSLLPEYGLLLDAIVPLAAPRVEFRDWDEAHWARTLRIAEWHRLRPALFAHVRSAADVPDAARAALEEAYLANAARSLFVRAEQRAALAALAGAEVPAMLLKGAALVETVYSDPALREMLDLDILVPADQLGSANAALAELGYRVHDAAGPDGPGGAPHHDPALTRSEQVLAVELHHHIVIAGEASGFAIDDFWRRAQRSEIGAHLVPVPEDLLLHVCLHFTRNRLGGSYERRHTGGALAQIHDIARIVEVEEIDWAALAATARSYRLDAAVFLALFAARELGVPLTADALARIRPAGFDPALGRRLVALRVLGGDDRLPIRSARWMLLPSREVLSRGWAADPARPLSVAGAYVRRAQANIPRARAALRRPLAMIHDRRLNGQIRALQEHS